MPVQNWTKTICFRPKSTQNATQNPLQDPKFYKFIAKAVPLLEAELEAAARSRAFDGYQLLDAEMDEQVRKLHTLDAAMTRTQNEGLRVSAITWSPTGERSEQSEFKVFQLYEH